MVNWTRQRDADEKGSVALALLAIMIILSFAMTLATTSIVQQRVTRKEKLSAIALEAADAGIQDARYRIINRLVQVADVQPSGRTTAVAGAVNGVPFSWTASYTASTLNWRVISRGGSTVTRTVAATLRQGSRFDVALFASNGIGFAGGNGANSYNGGRPFLACTSPGVPTNCSWNTGNGIVASDGNIQFGGNNVVDGVRVYDWANNPGSQRCPLQSAGTTYCVSPYRVNVDARLVLDQQLTDINNTLAACTYEGDSNGIWRSSDHLGANGKATFNFTAGSHCFKQLIFNVETVLPAGVTASSPLKVYVKDFLQVGKPGGGGTEINCAGCAVSSAPPPAVLPDAAALLIYTPVKTFGTGSGVAIYLQTKVAAGIYAPNGSCGSPGSSNSQVDIYGSLLCSDLTNQGGWLFHFDDNLAGRAGNGLFDIFDWNESLQ